MKNQRRVPVVAIVLAVVVLGPILLAVVSGLFAPRPVPPVAPIARPATSRPAPPAVPTTTRPPASPWKVESYYADDGTQARRVVCESVTLGGRVVVTGSDAALVWSIAPTYPMPRVNPGVEWRYGVGHGAAGGDLSAELRRERWIIQGGRLVLELVDDAGETDLLRGLELARALVALPETESVVLPYPTSDGKAWGLVLPVRGMRDALRQLAPSL